MINKILNRKNFARVSATPGKTATINFYDIDKKLMLVDLPGYGYARETKTRVNEWTALVMSYLRGRAPLRRVFVLIDARHGLKDNDHEVMDMLDEAAVSYQIVLTKTDKLKSGELELRLEEVRAALRKHVAAHPRIVATSSEKGTGIAELRAEVASLADPALLGYKPRGE